MPSVGKIIDSHNKKIISPHDITPACKCRDQNCPVNGECEESGIIYQCVVKETASGNVQSYVGLTERSFKDRHTKHKKRFRTR